MSNKCWALSVCAVRSLSVVSSSCYSMDCSPPGFSVPEASPGKNTGVTCHPLLQGIFPTQGSNSGPLHCRQILYQLSHKGSPGRLNGGMVLHDKIEIVSHSVMSDSVTPWTIQSLNSPGQNTGVGSFSLLQGIFPTQGLNTGLPHCRRILYQLSHKGSPCDLIAHFFLSLNYIPV